MKRYLFPGCNEFYRNPKVMAGDKEHLLVRSFVLFEVSIEIARGLYF